MSSAVTGRCPASETGRHSVREHDVAVDLETGYPTTVGVCVHCGRRQDRTEPEDYRREANREPDDDEACPACKGSGRLLRTHRDGDRYVKCKRCNGSGYE